MSVLWWLYARSGYDIVVVNGLITDIITDTLDDCNEFDGRNYKILIEYEYFYKGANYSDYTELCETSKGRKSVLKLHKINESVQIYFHKNNPERTNLVRKDLMNKYYLGFAIGLVFFTCVVIMCACGWYETLASESLDFLKEYLKLPL